VKSGGGAFGGPALLFNSFCATPAPTCCRSGISCRNPGKRVHRKKVQNRGGGGGGWVLWNGGGGGGGGCVGGGGGGVGVGWGVGGGFWGGFCGGGGWGVGGGGVGGGEGFAKREGIVVAAEKGRSNTAV